MLTTQVDSGAISVYHRQETGSDKADTGSTVLVLGDVVKEHQSCHVTDEGGFGSWLGGSPWSVCVFTRKSRCHFKIMIPRCLNLVQWIVGGRVSQYSIFKILSDPRNGGFNIRMD